LEKRRETRAARGRGTTAERKGESGRYGDAFGEGYFRLSLGKAGRLGKTGRVLWKSQGERGKRVKTSRERAGPNENRGPAGPGVVFSAGALREEDGREEERKSV
jgi:hypothetical protein